MENRTPDLVIANDALYQLSYDPKTRVLPTILAAAQGQSYLILILYHDLHHSSKHPESCFPKMSIWNSWDLYGLEARTAIGGDSKNKEGRFIFSSIYFILSPFIQLFHLLQ